MFGEGKMNPSELKRIKKFDWMSLLVTIICGLGTAYSIAWKNYQFTGLYFLIWLIWENGK